MDADKLTAQISDLPKAELHCHLDGLLDAVLLAEIWHDEAEFPIPAGGLDHADPVHDLESFFAWWQHVSPLKGKLLRYAPIIQRHIARLKAQNVRYFELFVSAGDVPVEPGAAVDNMQVFNAIVQQHAGPELQVRLLYAFGRNKSVEQVEQIADRALALHRAGLIAGVALAGPEIGWPVRPFRRAFARLHDAGVRLEIHAGEWCGPESVWDALENGYADRIGHGVALFQDPHLVAIFQERQIHIEMCPTSNLKTGSVRSLAEHPLGIAKELGLNFSINTDDPGVFSNSMEGEYRLAVEQFGFSVQDLRQVYSHTIQAAFGQQEL